MRLTVLGGSGAFPAAGQACSGYLVEQDGFRLLVDPGYGSLLRLLEVVAADEVDAVYVTHGHPDHCVDLNPLLRARALRHEAATPLRVHALPGALDAVLALDRPGMLADALELHEFGVGEEFGIGPFDVSTRLLPHWLPNAGVRLTAGGATLAYTGDTGPDPGVVALGRDADVLLAEATHVEEVPADSAAYLTSARQAGAQAAEAGVGRLVLTHLWPGDDPAAARQVAGESFGERIDVALPGLTVELAG